ncbi:MAG: metal-dependent hydrolase [Gemmatimonadetes bacterium]|nr:metal-dependent hydrolase [Gemmatimonadota bacterium]
MSEPEVWLRGPVPDVQPLLQPVAHSLLQCRHEFRATVLSLTPAQLSARPGGGASASFHARHAIGSLDRLLTYARGESLTPPQLDALAREAVAGGAEDVASRLVADFDAAVEGALGQLHATPESALLEPRAVGRARLPSTVIGLLFHAAEHTQRHVGQLVTIARVVRAGAATSGPG